MWGQRDSAFAQKMRDAMEKCRTKADSAREAAHRSWGESNGKPKLDSAKVAQRDSTRHVRIQGAIDAMEKNSARMAEKVRENQQQTAVRMQERRDELIQLQKKILERKAAREAEKASKEKEPATTDGAAQ
jgi:hypothetical protein